MSGFQSLTVRRPRQAAAHSHPNHNAPHLIALENVHLFVLCLACVVSGFLVWFPFLLGSEAFGLLVPVPFGLLELYSLRKAFHLYSTALTSTQLVGP